MYKVGMRFICEDSTWNDNYQEEEYILARINENEVLLISLYDGNRWNEAVRVEDDNQITQEEFNKITSVVNYIKWRIKE